MTPERWQQIDQLFHSALEHERGRRAAFLVRACAGDEALRHEVESLIESHELSNSFLDQPADDIAAELLSGAQTRPSTGQQIGHYSITALLGVGGMGEVYLAQDLKLGRQIALKLLPAEFTRQHEPVRRFEQEARAASALNHPNIVTIYEIGRSRSSHFIATEFIDGQTLRQHMLRSESGVNRERPASEAWMDIRHVLDIATQIASALAAAHAAGIVHRDIKPENIMLRRDGFVKLLDFGLAKLASPTLAKTVAGSVVETNPGVVMGTVQYMSPEQARGLDVDARTDIWSLGVVLYEMVNGRAPFEGETASHLIVSILEKEPLPLASETPLELLRILGKALHKNPGHRYQTASDLALDLKNLKEELEVEWRLRRSSGSDGNGNRMTTGSGRQRVITAVPTSEAHTFLADAGQPGYVASFLMSKLKNYKQAAPALILALVLLVVVAALGLNILLRQKLTASTTPDAPFQAIEFNRLTNMGE